LRILYSWASQHSRVAARLLAETSHVVDVPRPPLDARDLGGRLRRDAEDARLVRGPEAERRARRVEQRCSDSTRFDTVAPLRRRLGGSQLAPAAPGARSVGSARGRLAVEIEALDATSHRRRAAAARAHRDASCSPSPTSPRSTTASSTAAAPPVRRAPPSAPTSCPLPPPARLPRALLVCAHRRVDCMSVIEIDVDGNSNIDTLSTASSNDTIAWYASVGPQSFAEYVRNGDRRLREIEFVFAMPDTTTSIRSCSLLWRRVATAWYQSDGSRLRPERVSAATPANRAAAAPPRCDDCRGARLRDRPNH